MSSFSRNDPAELAAAFSWLARGALDDNYADLSDMPAPLSTANLLNYGASTTPTLVLINGAGIVRYYHPGAVSEANVP